MNLQRRELLKLLVAAPFGGSLAAIAAPTVYGGGSVIGYCNFPSRAEDKTLIGCGKPGHFNCYEAKKIDFKELIALASLTVMPAWSLKFDGVESYYRVHFVRVSIHNPLGLEWRVEQTK